MNPVSNVHVGDHVEITLLSDPSRISSGTVAYVFPDSDSGRITVLLKNGDRGRVIQVLNSDELTKGRIMREDQYTENKENFSEDVMRNKVIPQTVQSFLNAEGGRVYIGVRDTGTLQERLVGLYGDFSQIPDHENTANDKLCDELERRIMDALDRHLSSVVSLGSLVDIKFISVLGIQIAEINVLQSPKPWFYRHLSRNNKPQVFELRADSKTVTERTLDDFYIRQGGRKKLLSTHEEFYTYAIHHFK